MTALPNPFIISGSASVPFAKPEAASLIAPHDAVTLSDGVGAKPILAFTPSEAATDPGREPVAATNLPCAGAEPATRQANHGRAAVGRTGGSIPPTGATTLTHNAVTQAVEVRTNLEDELTHLIGVAGKRRRRPLALPPFSPDFPELWKAMHDKSAPRTVLDPLWADESPLFLRDAS